MAASDRFVIPYSIAINGVGVVAPGSKLYFYVTGGTTTPKDTYSEETLVTPNLNPMTADLAGRFGACFLGAGSYRVVLKSPDAAGNLVEVWTADPVSTVAGLLGKQTLSIPASAMTQRTTNGAAATTAEFVTNKNMMVSLDFDTATQEFAQFEIYMPKGWDEGTLTFQPLWTAGSGSGGVVWALQCVGTGDGDALDVAFGTEQTSTDTLLAANQCHIAPESAAITCGGAVQEGDRVQFQIKRNVAAASDTLGVDAQLLGIRLYLTYNSGNDN